MNLKSKKFLLGTIIGLFSIGTFYASANNGIPQSIEELQSQFDDFALFLTDLDARVTQNENDIANIPAPTPPFDDSSIQTQLGDHETRITTLEGINPINGFELETMRVYSGDPSGTLWGNEYTLPANQLSSHKIQPAQRCPEGWLPINAGYSLRGQDVIDNVKVTEIQVLDSNFQNDNNQRQQEMSIWVINTGDEPITINGNPIGVNGINQLLTCARIIQSP